MAFCILVFSKHIQLFLNCLHKFVINIDRYAQEVKCFVFVGKNIQVVKLDQFQQGGSQIALLQCLAIGIF